MIFKISGNMCPAMVQIQKFRKFMSNTSRDIIRYVFTVASEDPVQCSWRDVTLKKLLSDGNNISVNSKQDQKIK